MTHLPVEVLRRPVEPGQYTSWAFGQRLRRAGLLGSMGSIGDCFDNALAESFFSSLQVELLDRQSWATRQQLANAIFEWIEAWYNPRRRHSALDYLSPIDYERAHTPAATAA
jgi:putative transposase